MYFSISILMLLKQYDKNVRKKVKKVLEINKKAVARPEAALISYINATKKTNNRINIRLT